MVILNGDPHLLKKVILEEFTSANATLTMVGNLCSHYALLA